MSPYLTLVRGQTYVAGASFISLIRVHEYERRHDGTNRYTLPRRGGAARRRLRHARPDRLLVRQRPAIRDQRGRFGSAQGLGARGERLAKGVPGDLRRIHGEDRDQDRAVL